MGDISSHLANVIAVSFLQLQISSWIDIENYVVIPRFLQLQHHK